MVETTKEEYSVFNDRTLEEIYEEVRKVYIGDKRPWVIGYSGGKDSTSAIQLVWNALKGLTPEQRTKPVFVISSDTLVETPVIVGYIDTTLQKIEESAKDQDMPFTASKVTPRIDESFWVNLIGRGYPAPSNRFRWCTERLKIKPADEFILNKVAEFGEVILILGVRKGESTTRDQVLSLHRIKGSLLSTHSSLPHAYVYTPIVNFSVKDVWDFLLQIPSPWGANNRDLLAIYRNANAEECPLVVDKTTPSCGNSRFGCWVCTVVDKDKSMEALVDKGEEWLLPLLEFRDLLSETQDPAKKRIYRDYRRRDGRVWHTPSKDIVRGPYRFNQRKDFLRRVLEMEKTIKETRGEDNLSIIQMEELKRIRQLWIDEEHDWEDSVPKIYFDVFGEDPGWVRDDSAIFSEEDLQLLEKVCMEEDLSADLVAELLDMERQLQGMTRRSDVFSRMDRIFKKDWRSEEEVLLEAEEMKKADSGVDN